MNRVMYYEDCTPLISQKQVTQWELCCGKYGLQYSKKGQHHTCCPIFITQFPISNTARTLLSVTVVARGVLGEQHHG